MEIEFFLSCFRSLVCVVGVVFFMVRMSGSVVFVILKLCFNDFLVNVLFFFKLRILLMIWNVMFNKWLYFVKVVICVVLWELFWLFVGVLLVLFFLWEVCVNVVLNLVVILYRDVVFNLMICMYFVMLIVKLLCVEICWSFFLYILFVIVVSWL